jgi:hypothetical protein
VKGVHALAALALVSASGCGLLFEEPASPSPAPALPAPTSPPLPPADAGDLPDTATTTEAGGIPAGHGTLRQEELAIRLRRGELELFVVPLDEAVIRTAAPDTWERLSALGRSHRQWFRDRTGSDAPYRLFLVALYTEAEPLAFEPDEMAVVTGGIRLRPVLHRGLTPAWDQRRIQPGEPQMAIYAFPPEVRLDADLEVEYHEVRSRDWARVLPAIEAEQARVRARAGGG